MTEHVVVVGAGHAGAQAVASLREAGFEGRLTLIGDEADLPYHKPPLSKTFIKDAAAQPQILRAEAFYQGAKVDLRLGERVAALDPAAGRLEMASGGPIAFDRAILATGARPRPLPGTPEGLSGILALRSLADARLLREAAANAEDVVIVGGGFIGLEIAATLAAGGRRVTVLEAQERLLARAVAAPLAEHVRSRLEAGGVRVVTGAKLATIEGAAGRLEAVTLATGERIPARLLIVGIGVVPNVELAAAAGLAVENGVSVDATLTTSAPNVLAAGDVASYRHWQTGGTVRLESVQNATDQARHAAQTILGHPSAYAAVPWFWSDIGDMKLQMVGLVGGSDRQVVAGEPADNRFSIYHFLSGRLIGIESVNRPADHMLGRRMLADGFSPPEALVAGGGELKAAYEAFRQGRGAA